MFIGANIIICKHTFNFILSLFFLTFILVDCAKYQPQVVEVKSAELYKYKTSKSGIIIAVDPYDTKEKCESAFYADLTSKNVKVLHVIIENNSEYNIEVGRSDIKVFDKNGHEYKQLDSKEVFDMFEHDEFLHYLLFGIFGSIAADEANDAMIADWDTKELDEIYIIISGTKGSGFVFFQTENKLIGGTSKIKIRNVDSKVDINFDITIL